MKKWLLFLLAILTGYIVIQYYKNPLLNPVSFLYYFPCDSTIRYRVDTIDSRFKIPRKELLSDIERAGSIWNKTYGKNLFVYDPEGKLSINLIYDKRQYLTSQINELEGQLESSKDSISFKIQEYEKDAVFFKQNLEKLNAEIFEWNKKGGAPSDVFERLTEKQEELKKEADRLNSLSRVLNRSTESYNAQVGELNTTIQSFNQTLRMKPEEGLYNPKENRIEIYFNTNKDELIHTLAHELGHSLGIEHNQDRESIMYPYTTRKTTSSTEDVVGLRNTCRRRSIFEPISERFSIVYKKLTASN